MSKTKTLPDGIAINSSSVINSTNAKACRIAAEIKLVLRLATRKPFSSNMRQSFKKECRLTLKLCQRVLFAYQRPLKYREPIHQKYTLCLLLCQSVLCSLRAQASSDTSLESPCYPANLQQCMLLLRLELR